MIWKICKAAQLYECNNKTCEHYLVHEASHKCSIKCCGYHGKNIRCITIEL